MRLLCSLCLLTLLVACAGEPPRAPVEDRYGRRIGRDAMVPDTYSVKRGDTLYAIAWRYGFDFRKLANANAISEPYTIYVGQTLKLRESGRAPAAAAGGKNTSKPVPKSAGTPAVVAAAKPPSGAASGGVVSQWRWPTSGKVVRGFSSVHKGIDVDGQAGDPVYAVAAGRVVYAGTGIVGYGKLLIVKHNDLYLSAYGHNRELLVSEGDSVKAGQRISEKGSSATNTVKLHFEIRREGKPVDPIKLLPARRAG